MAAAKTSFEPLFRPRGVAIVGASHDLRRIGGQPVKFLATYGYKGRVYPINPKHAEIAGLRCYPSVASIDGPCDVALVAVNGAAAVEVVRECGRKGIRFAVVFSAGFRETGAAGLEQEARLLEAAREHGVRIIGPNCQGYLNISERLYATFGVLGLEPELKAGPVSSVAQSGGFGFGIVTQCESAGVGFRNLVSSGNESGRHHPRDPRRLRGRRGHAPARGVHRGRARWSRADAGRRPVGACRQAPAHVEGRQLRGRQARLAFAHRGAHRFV